MEMIGKKTTREKLKNNGWEEKEPFGWGEKKPSGMYIIFEKACTKIGWNPETGVVELQRKKS